MFRIHRKKRRREKGRRKEKETVKSRDREDPPDIHSATYTHLGTGLPITKELHTHTQKKSVLPRVKNTFFIFVLWSCFTLEVSPVPELKSMNPL